MFCGLLEKNFLLRGRAEGFPPRQGAIKAILLCTSPASSGRAHKALLRGAAPSSSSATGSASISLAKWGHWNCHHGPPAASSPVLSLPTPGFGLNHFPVGLGDAIQKSGSAAHFSVPWCWENSFQPGAEVAGTKTLQVSDFQPAVWRLLGVDRLYLRSCKKERGKANLLSAGLTEVFRGQKNDSSMGNLTGSEIKKKKTESVVVEAKCSNRRIMQESLAVHLILISCYFFSRLGSPRQDQALCCVPHQTS